MLTEATVTVLFEASVSVLTDSVVKMWTEMIALVTEVHALVLTKNLVVHTGKRKRQETRLIFKLGTSQPHGLKGLCHGSPVQVV